MLGCLTQILIRLHFAKQCEVQAACRIEPAGGGLIINSSRAILYASNGDDFAAAARRETERLRDEINAHRKGFAR